MKVPWIAWIKWNFKYVIEVVQIPNWNWKSVIILYIYFINVVIQIKKKKTCSDKSIH